MSIWQRIKTFLKSNINDVISNAEDPAKILEQLIIDMRQQFQEARKEVAKAVADEKRLQRQYEKERTQATEWEGKVKTAIIGGDDDLARKGLAKKLEAEKICGEFHGQWQAQVKQTSQLREALKRLNQKIQEAGRKKNLLIARQRRAEAQKRIQDTMSGMSDASAFDSFARMEERIEQIEAEADAAVELSEDMHSMDLDQQFAALEGSDAVLDDQLRALKASMGLATEEPVALTDQRVDQEVITVETVETTVESDA
ncbi:MAG: PspA/IM30 family protein [Myxococcota bacterium]|nr:PspA/IM30 family protein [Myxococcota bacterium]